MRLQSVRIGVGIAALAAAAGVLWNFPPATSSFYPSCPFHSATGLLCPGCGGTRALAALLHGRLAEAWGDNALLMLLLPLFAAYFLVGCYRRLRSEDAVWPAVTRGQVAALVTVAVGFAVWRNLG